MKKISIFLLLCLFLAAFLIWPKAPDLLLRRHVNELFSSRRYEELSALLRSLEDKSHKSLETEQRLEDALNAFAVSDPAFESLFEEWIQKEPQSYVPHLARAIYEMALACPDCSDADLGETVFPENVLFRFEKGRQEVLSALKIDEKNLSAYVLLMNMNRYLKKAEENISLFQKGLQFYPASFSLRFSYLMSLASQINQDTDQIHDFIEITLKAEAGNSSLKSLRGFLKWREGVLLMKNKQFNEAVVKFTEALSFGGYWKYYADRAESHFSLNRFDNALKDIRDALALRPQKETLYLLKAKIDYRRGNLETASEDIKTAENIWPYASSIHEVKTWLVEDLIYRAYREYQNRQFDNALKALDHALRLNPAHPEIYSWRSMVLKDQGKLDEALVDLKRSIKLNPSNYASCMALKELLPKGEGHGEMIECWSNFLLLNPSRADAYFERGVVYWQTDQRPKAIQDMKTACDLGLKTACEKYESFMNGAREQES